MIASKVQPPPLEVMSHQVSKGESPPIPSGSMGYKPEVESGKASKMALQCGRYWQTGVTGRS